MCLLIIIRLIITHGDNVKGKDDIKGKLFRDGIISEGSIAIKIFKHTLCDLIDEFENENGTGRVWINTGFYDDLDPSTWRKATINSPFVWKVAIPCDAQNKFWVKCIPQEVPDLDLVRAFPADKRRYDAWALAGY